MNIIKLDNLKSILSSTHSIELKSDYRFNSSGTIIIFSEDDLNNDNLINKLRGHKFDIVIVPKKFKYTLQETPLFKVMLPSMFNDAYHVSFF